MAGALAWYAAQLGKRDRIWIITAAVMIIVTALAAYWTVAEPPTTPGKRPGLGDVVSGTILSLSIAVLAAVMLNTLTDLSQLMRLKRRQDLFKRLWGLADDGRSVAVVLPRFMAPPGTPLTKESVGPGSVNASRRPVIEGESTRLAMPEDIRAATRIIALFTALELPLPQVIWDCDVVTFANPVGAGEYGSFIAIGLFSNDLTWHVNKEETLFHLSPPDTTDGKWTVSLSNTDRRCNIDSENPMVFPSQDTVDAGLLARVKLSDGRRVFIIGGIRAGTTEKLGSYLEEYWEQVAGWRDRESGLDVKQIEVRFATILDVRIGEARGIRDEKVRVAPL